MATPALSAESENKCQLINVQTLPITFSGSGFAPTIGGSINGKPTKVLIDLSAYETSIDTAALDAFGISYREAHHNVPGIGGPQAAHEAFIEELKAGPAKGSGWFRAYHFGEAEIGFRFGADSLLRLDLEISMAQKYIKFWRPVDCADNHLAHWDVDAVSIPFNVEADDARPRFKVRINGHDAEAMLSPASSVSVIDSKLAKRIGLVPDALADAGKVKGTGSRLVNSWIAKIGMFEIGDEKIENAKIRMLDTGPTVQVILGADFIRAHRILISAKQHKVYLTHTGGDPFSQLSYVDETWFQAEVAGGNPDAQVRMGDVEGERPGAERDKARQMAWYQKAAVQGNRSGLIKLAEMKFDNGDFAGSAVDLKRAQARGNTAELIADLYLASARSGRAAQALDELKANKIKSTDEWFKHVIDFLVGKIDANELRKRAGKGASAAPRTLCTAEYYIWQSHIIAGQLALARPAAEAVRATCGSGPLSDAAQLYLGRLSK